MFDRQEQQQEQRSLSEQRQLQKPLLNNNQVTILKHPVVFFMHSS